MAEMMGDMMRGVAVNAVESVMDSGAMQVREDCVRLRFRLNLKRKFSFLD